MKSIKECEQSSMHKLLNFKLPNYAKKIGWSLFIVSFVILLLTKFFEGDWDLLKGILKKIVLVSLFIVVLSREKVEDERLQQLRAKAFSFTFLVTAIYILVQPLINFIASYIVENEKAVLEDLGDFVILWFMLIIYLMFFNLSKKTS